VLNPDFKEFIQSLNDNQVRYLIIGGYAVALHGYPRYTKDIDIWIEMSEENAERILAALAQFGFASLDLTTEDFTTADRVIQLGYPPNRIDRITTPDGVEFSTCYAQKVDTELDELVISFIDLENLKLNKKASGRLQDLADLENLEQ
jgi:hypothetical protein